MLQERLDTFLKHFADILPQMIDKYPDMYRYPKEHVPIVITRISTNLIKNGTVNGQIIDSPTWRAVCKAAAIGFWRGVILTSLTAEPIPSASISIRHSLMSPISWLRVIFIPFSSSLDDEFP